MDCRCFANSRERRWFPTMPLRRQEGDGISTILWGPTEKECGFMWIAVLSALVCFAVATILFTPPLRSYPFYQVLSFYFLFEGAWTLLNAAVDLIWPGSNVLVWVHCIRRFAVLQDIRLLLEAKARGRGEKERRYPAGK